jgi:long-chain fatty acid transport protein
VDITPAIAYQVHPKVSVGAGVDYVNLFDAQLDRQVNVSAVNTSLGAPSLSPDAVSSLRGSAADWGYHAGVVIQPTEQHSLGITYHSKQNLRVNGNVTLTGMSGMMATVFGGPNFSASAFTDVVLPANVQFGYAFKPNDKWLFEADTAWFHWSEGRDLNVRYPTIDPTTVAGATQLAVLTNSGAGNPTQLSARDAWSANAGVNYKASDKWQFRGGFWYEPWVLPESTFSPAFADLTRYGVSTGAGYAITESVTIDAAYTAVFFHNRTINNSTQVNATGIPEGAIANTGTNGTYKDFANLVALNVTYRFGAAK